MRIVYVVPLLAPYAIPRYQELARLNDTEVHVIIEQDTHKERIGWSFQKVDGVHMYLLNSRITDNYKQMNRKDRYVQSKTRVYSFGLQSLISQISPDVVLVCNSTQIMMLYGKRDYKLGIVVEDTLRADEARSVLKRMVKKAMLKKADFYLPFTTDARNYLKHYGINGPFVNSSWSMDTKFFADLSIDERKVKRKEYGMDDTISYILVSSLIPRKGIREFLQGWSSMKKEFHDRSKLFILGDGELKSQISEQIIQDRLSNVLLLGNKDYQEVSHYLQSGDVFVLPTLEDLCSLSVLEAMASGRPILTTIYNGAREFVKEGVNGFIFDPLDKESIKETLKKVDMIDLNQMSVASYKMIKMYSTEKVMGSLRKDLEQIFNKEDASVGLNRER